MNDKLKNLLEELDSQILEGISIGRRFSAPNWSRAVSKVVFCGMGGSAIGGDILRILVMSHVPAGRTPLIFEVQRSGKIPAWVDSSTLVVFSSYSGGTPEVLHNVDAARKAKAKILILSSGGKLILDAAKYKIPFIQVPGGLPPRCAIGYLTFALMPVFAKWGWLKFSAAEASEIIRTVRGVSRAGAKALAKRLYGRSIHFYGFSNFAEPILTRWRAQLAENSKTLASSHLIPEMLHNEIEAWKFPSEIIKKSTAVFFADKNDAFWLRNKIKAGQKIIKSAGADVLEIKSEGNSLVARVFFLLVLADWVSYELASLNKVDPIAIPAIMSLKKVN